MVIPQEKSESIEKRIGEIRSLLINSIGNICHRDQKKQGIMNISALTCHGYVFEEIEELVHDVSFLRINQVHGRFPTIFASGEPTYKMNLPNSADSAIFKDMLMYADCMVEELLKDICKLDLSQLVDLKAFAKYIRYPLARVVNITRNSPSFVFFCGDGGKTLQAKYSPKENAVTEKSVPTMSTESEELIAKIQRYCWSKQTSNKVTTTGYDNRLPRLRDISNSVKLKQNDVVDLIKNSDALELFDNQEIGGTTIPIKSQGSWKVRCLKMPNKEKIAKLLGSVKCLIQVYENALKMVEDIPEVIGESYVSMSKENIESCISFLEDEVDRMEKKLKEGEGENKSKDTPPKPKYLLL